MADEQDRFSILNQPPQHYKQFLGFHIGQHRGGLIQDQYFRSAIERLEYLRPLLFTHGCISSKLVWIDIKSILLGNLPDLFLKFLFINKDALGWFHS